MTCIKLIYVQSASVMTLIKTETFFMNSRNSKLTNQIDLNMI